jgi:hypothetical protein
VKETPFNKIPYPEDTDAPDGPTQIKALAERLDFLQAVSRGSVKANGEKLSGTGFTVEKTATGKYRMTYSAELPAIPVVVATAAPEPSEVTANGDRHAIVVQDQLSKTAARVWIYNAAGALVDCPFHFAIWQP